MKGSLFDSHRIVLSSYLAVKAVYLFIYSLLFLAHLSFLLDYKLKRQGLGSN